jgi:hypothetical protein
VQGRLTKHEFDARVSQALLARTLADLAALTADIPAGSIPRPVRKPAKTSRLPSHAVGRAVACALIALAAVAIAEMPGLWTKPARPNMSMKACYAFYDWIGAQVDQERGTPGMPVDPTLNRAVNDARQGTDRALAADLPKLQHAYRRYERLSVPPLSPASRHSAANHVRADTNQVVSDCQARGG